MRKLIGFDEETANALKLLAQDRMADFQELADEAFADLLKKHGRPVDLKAALRGSLRNASKPQADKPASRKQVRGPTATRKTSLANKGRSNTRARRGNAHAQT